MVLKLGLHHFVETLSMGEEKLLITYLLQNKESLSKEETLILRIFERYIHENNGIKLLFLVNLKKAQTSTKVNKGEKQKVEIFTINDELGTISLTESTILEKSTFGNEKIRSLQETETKESLSDILTFMSFYEKHGEYSIKVKMNNTSGSLFKQKTPKQIIPIINDVLDEEIFTRNVRKTIINGKTFQFSVNDWVVIMEIIMRYFTEINKNGKKDNSIT